MGKRNFKPKDIEDLLKMSYSLNESQKNRNKRYNDYIDTRIDDKIREKEAKRVLKGFGESIKIPRKSKIMKKTPDYVIKTSKIVYEITSIQASEDEAVNGNIKYRTKERFIEDINDALNHVKEKDYSEYPNFIKGAIIFTDVILSAITGYNRYFKDLSLITNTDFIKLKFDFLILLPQQMSINKELNRIAYVKEKRLRDAFMEKLPEDMQVFLLE